MNNLPIYRAKSDERKNTYVEGFLIGVDEDIGLCTIRTKDDYIGGEICYLDTLSIHFPDMTDSNGNKIFASLQEDGKGGDICNLYLFKNQDKPTRENYTCRYKNQKIMFKNFNFENYAKIEIIGIQE